MVFVLLAGGAGVFIWLKITALKNTIANDLGAAIGANVEVASLDFDMWHGEIHAAGITLENKRPGAPWEKGSISQVMARFHPLDIFSPQIKLNIDVSSWTLVLCPSPAAGTASSPDNSGTSNTMPGADTSNAASGTASPDSPRRLEVTDLTAHAGEVTIELPGNRQLLAHGVAFDASNNSAGVWTTTLQAASLDAGTLTADASSVDIRSETDKVTFSSLRMQCAQGFITGNGEVALESGHDAKFTLKFTSVPVTMLVSAPWQMQLTGLVDEELSYTGNDQSGIATGQISVNQAKLNVLPWLGQVTSLARLPDVSNVELDKATSDFSWKDGTLHLTNIDVRKNDVIRIGGDVDVAPGGNVEGRLKLGLPSAVTARWPDLQTKIFSDQHDDFSWTDVHLTGTPDHLEQDLTPRLVALGAQEGNGLLNQAAQKATDLLKSFMGN